MGREIIATLGLLVGGPRPGHAGQEPPRQRLSPTTVPSRPWESPGRAAEKAALADEPLLDTPEEVAKVVGRKSSLVRDEPRRNVAFFNKVIKANCVVCAHASAGHDEV